MFRDTTEDTEILLIMDHEFQRTHMRGSGEFGVVRLGDGQRFKRGEAG